MREPDEATLSCRTMATTAVAARTIYPSDAALDDVYACAQDRFDKAAREDLAAAGTIADAVGVVARGQRRDLR